MHHESGVQGFPYQVQNDGVLFWVLFDPNMNMLAKNFSFSPH
jgi:hypothetical protein